MALTHYIAAMRRDATLGTPELFMLLATLDHLDEALASVTRRAGDMARINKRVKDIEDHARAVPELRVEVIQLLLLHAQFVGSMRWRSKRECESDRAAFCACLTRLRHRTRNLLAECA